MSGSERAESQASRSTHTVHVLAPSWPDVAERLQSIVARTDAAADGLQALIVVPAARDAVALAGAIRAAGGPGAMPLATVRRARRLLGAVRPPIAVTTPGVALSLLRASALFLGSVRGVALVAADELARDRAALDAVLAEVPRGVAKVLTCTAMTPFVDELVAAHLHGARRLEAPSHVPPTVSGPPIEVLPVATGAPAGALADVLELVDAPTAAIVPGSAAYAEAARSLLAALGYPDDSPLARVVPDGAAGGAALVVLLGAPSAAQLAAVRSAAPARIVALVTARERAVLASRDGAGPLQPFAPAPSHDDAVAAEEALRDRIRRDIRAQLPAREMLALEPLLDEFDALTVAAAVLRMHEARAARSPRAPEPAAAAPARRGAGRIAGSGGARSAGPDGGERRGPRRDDRAERRESHDRGERREFRDRGDRRHDRGGRDDRSGGRDSRGPRRGGGPRS